MVMAPWSRSSTWGWVFPWILVVSWGSALGQEVGPGEPTTGPVAEEVNEALEDLDQAGVPPSAEDTQDFARDLEATPRPRFGAMAFRMGYRPTSGPTGSVGLVLGPGSWHVRARVRRDAAGLVARSVVAGWERPSLTLRAGTLGFRHGFGLLMGPPGRSSSLGADQSLGPGEARLIGWTGMPDHRTWAGVGVGLARGRWRFYGLVGQDPEETNPTAPQLKFLRVGVAGPHGQVTVAGLTTGSSRAISLGGAHRRDRLKGSMEGVLWLDPAGDAQGWAGVAHGSWSPVSGHALEGTWAAADLDGVWRAGTRPSVLPSWSGHGYALRVRSTPGPGMSLRGLWHQGWALPGAGSGERSQRRLTELQWHQRVSEGWALALRYRRSSDVDLVWSRRHPWLPAVPTPTDLKTVMTAKLTHDHGAWRVDLMVRTLDRQAPAASGRRSMIGLQVKNRPHRDWTLRFFAATAWGEDVDLVSAVVPYAGLVLSRHWGKWRSETGLGISRTGRWCSFRLAGGRRRPEPDRGEEGEFWMRTALDWGW